MGDSESANTIWTVNWLNKVNPNRYWDPEDSYPVRYKISESSNKIIIKDAYFENRIEFEGEILSMSKDTIRLGTRDSLMYWHEFLTFIKLKNKTSTQLTIDDLHANVENESWIYEDGGLKFRLDFKDDHMYEDSTMPKLVNFNSLNGVGIDSFGRWRLKKFKDQFILSIHSINFEYGTIEFFLKEVYEDSIIADRSFGKYLHQVTLKRIPSDPQKEETLSNLTSKKWMINNFTQLEQSYGNSSPSPYYDQNEEYDLNILDLKNGIVSLEFDTYGKFKIYKNSKLLFVSEWELSSDSRYIFIKDYYTSSIEIINLTENEIKMRMDLMVWGEDDITQYSYKSDEVEIDFEGGMYYQILFELEAEWP